MKHPKLWDSISTILVLFGFGLYGSSCWYGVWALVDAAPGRVVLGVLVAVFTQRCQFCHRYLGMMFFTGKRRTARTAAATCARAETFDSAVIFRYAGCIMHVKAGIP
jgi:hypothetical protein